MVMPRRWMGVVESGPWGGWFVEVRSHGFPAELYLVALGRPVVRVALGRGRDGGGGGAHGR